MARYELTYSGEHRTRSVGIKLTPSERRDLEAHATMAGLPLSAYMRERCLSNAIPLPSSTRRNPTAKALAFELNAIGTNLNQLTHRSHITGDMPAYAELREVLDLLKTAIAKVIAS
jgi:hypothetical protein